MIYNSVTVNYTSSVVFNSLTFLSVSHLFYETPRFLYLRVLGYYFPLTQVTFKLKCIILLKKSFECVGGYRRLADWW